MSEIDAFERECAVAGVSPSAALRAGGLNPSTWFRWKAETASPTLRSLSAARDGLRRLIDLDKPGSHGGDPCVDDAATVPIGGALGAGAKSEIVQ